MKILLDENFPKAARNFLESMGHEVLDIRGTPLEGSTDAVLFDFAQAENATILSTDKDFFHTLPLFHPEHCGIIVVSLRQPSGRALLKALESNWPLLASEDIRGKTFLIMDRRVLVRRGESQDG